MDVTVDEYTAQCIA